MFCFVAVKCAIAVIAVELNGSAVLNCLLFVHQEYLVIN